MKPLLLIPLAGLLAGAGWFAYRSDPSDQSHPLPEPPASPPPTTTSTDSTKIFQQAFWKRPAAADKILHAERREWSDKDGITKWQWFLAVEPSPELVKHLREDNAFSLVAGTPPPRPGGAPEWFAFDPGDVAAMHAPSGGLTLIFSKTGNLLYATDAGGGFKPGAPEPVTANAEATTTGRLPLTPPPNPSNP